MTEKIHLVVATPCFGGQVSSIYASSIFQLQRAVRSLSNMDLKIELSDGDALITRARANLVTLFLDDPAATHLLFVDADIGFTPDQVFRLIESGADVVAGVYPIKRVNWDKAKRAIDGKRPNVPAAALDYVLEINDPDHVAVVNGFTRVRYAGTGFLMIRRHVLEKMCAHPAYAPLQFFREHSLDSACRKPQPVCAVRMHDRSGDRHLSERGFRLLQTLDRYRRRNMGRSCRAGSTMSVRPSSAARSRRNLPRPRLRPMLREIEPASPEPAEIRRPPCADRIGLAQTDENVGARG